MNHFARALGRPTMRGIPVFRVLAAVFITATVAGCSGDNVVYRDRAPFNAPPDAASGFLGYYDAAAKQTTCGNCHSGFQASWQTTAHAGAYATLTASTGKAPECYGCHTLTGKGNATGGTTSGHDKVQVNTYYDVQCESCHGPGLKHVEGVSQGSLIRPLAKLSMSGTGNCGDCHSGVHQPFAEEWRLSRHSNVSASRAANATCAGCHDGRKALLRWGEDANYVERDGATAYQPTTCAVCHDPHGSTNPNQLRFSITSADPEENLCMRCHLRIAEPTVSTSSPHAPQGAMLLGFAGWRPPGFAYDTSWIYGSHATTKNPRLCAGCHVNRFTVTDKLTGAFTFQSTGHLMRPVPCLDATGKPDSLKTCPYTTTARTWQSCTASGCHASAAVAATMFNDSRALMKSFTDQLWRDLQVPPATGSGSMQASPTDGGMLPTVRATRPAEWSNTDNTITPAEGAEFNARLCGEYGQSNSDNSKGVHNPFLCRALMIATINYVRTYYGLPSASVAEQANLDRLSRGEFFRSMHVSRRPPGR